ncbi:DUF3833 domain-containing protein [Tabrizicola sp.]|jgi:hypothetical protein|uniref:DUF3833 domain-containing protein n=1 Tax=Tabrizicola sp. TaxID=2005166 RepID=UPI0025DF45F3|nr:DUF3833 domain-containing protein [Tabrizicola sp.]MBY0350538.1 DUF3833 domain-containing protein [Tabrizicola sp.]MDK2774436.1 DUF3833 domain-containing protein [Tabrizicola sp.]
MTPILAALLGALTVLGVIALRARFASFTAQRPADYASGPAFDLRRHLNGPLACDGVIFGPTGRVTSRFVADMEGRWEGSTGTLSEEFRYDSGSIQHRAWTLALGEGGRIIATAPDVVGQGEGRVAGSGVMLRYRIRLTPEAGGHVLDVVDWMYLMENGTIMNRSQFRKFGIKVAELVATMRPLEKPATLALAAE